MQADLEVLARDIKRAQYVQHRTLDAALGKIGTTLTQWDALRAIGNHPGASAHDLATATFQTDQAFGTLAGRLEAQGMIERKPGGGRRIEHRLTPAGSRTLRDANVIADRIRNELFAPLTQDDRRQLQRLLDKLLAKA